MTTNNINKPMLSLVLIVFHIALGFAIASSSVIAMIWCGAILLLGLSRIIRSKNQNDEAMLWSAYIAAADVPLRACGGALLWDIGKWGVMLFLIIGLLVSKKKVSIPLLATSIFILILPGVISTFSWSDNVREALTFNISGMMCLIVSLIYFFKRTISYYSLKEIFSYSLMPIVVLSIVLFYRTPSLDSITFESSANFATSGGFGPNQVATILGYGWLIVLVMIYLKQKVTSNTIITYGLFLFLLYRSLFTFSRGGNFAAILAFVCFFFFYSSSHHIKDKSSKSLVTLLLVGVMGFGIVLSIDSVTEGMFSNRFTGRDSSGEKREDITTGRNDILMLEYELFKDHPLGVGVGGSRYYRLSQFDDDHASHNEFGRLLSEHGIFGLAVILIMLISPLSFSRKLPDAENKAFCLMFYVLCVASMMHSGCRTAIPEFLYGLSFIYLTPRT